MESSFRNRDRAAQLVDFAGMKYGKCSPTDMDLTIEFQGNLFIFAELKYRNAPLPTGQRIYLQNIVKALTLGGKRAIAFVARHDTPVGEDIRAHSAIVHEYYTETKGWENLKEDYGEHMTLNHAIGIEYAAYESEKERKNAHK